MKKILLLLTIILSGCVNTKEIFSSMEYSEKENYGYSKENPILIGYYNFWQKNADLSYDYLSKLKYNNKPLKMVMHATVDKPKDQPRKKTFPQRYGTPMSLGGIFLDLYVMSPRGSTDTIYLYIDEEIKGELKIPKGLEYDKDQVNNIFR